MFNSNNFINKVLENDVEEFYQSIQTSDKKNDFHNHINRKNFSACYGINMNRINIDSYNFLVSEGNSIFKSIDAFSVIYDYDKNNSPIIYGNRFLNYLVDNAVVFEEEYDLENAIKLIYSLQQKLGSKLYGAILSNGSKKLNILHPLIAIEVFNNFDEFKKSTYNVTIYTEESNFYEARGSTENFELIKSKVSVDIEEHSEKVVSSMLSLYKNRESTDSKILIRDSIERIKENIYKRNTNDIQIEYSIDKDGFDYHNRDNRVLVPCQILSNGISAPHYGAVFYNCRNNLSKNLTPFFSANISQENFYNQNKNFSLTCTGDKRTESKEGMESLNHSYLGSAYNDYACMYGYWIFKDVCIKTSLAIFSNILSKEEILKIFSDEPVPSKEENNEQNWDEIFESNFKKFKDEPNPITEGLFGYTNYLVKEQSFGRGEAVKRYREVCRGIRKKEEEK